MIKFSIDNNMRMSHHKNIHIYMAENFKSVILITKRFINNYLYSKARRGGSRL